MGRCPDYGFVIHHDGWVEYFGESSVAVTGYCSARLSPRRLRDLRAVIAASRIESPPDWAEGSSSDAPITIVRVPLPDGGALEREGEPISVYRRGKDGGLVEEPVGITATLARKIESLADSAQLVGDRSALDRNPDASGAAHCAKVPKAWAGWFPYMIPPPQPAPVQEEVPPPVPPGTVPPMLQPSRKSSRP
jgi:hypothetical protein